MCKVRLSLFLKASVPECGQTHKVKTLMNKQNVTTQANDSGDRLTIKDLPVELAELSDEALSQVCGGIITDLSQFIFNGSLRFGGGGDGSGAGAGATRHYYYLAPPPDFEVPVE